MPTHQNVKPWSVAEKAARREVFDTDRATVPPHVLAGRDRRAGLQSTLNQAILGDPPDGYSALDRRRA